MRAVAVCLILCCTVLATARAGELRVVTYNINWGNPQLQQTVRILEKLDADVVALQETNAESQRALRRELKLVYPHQRYVIGKKHAAGGFAFLSKHKLHNVRLLPAKHGLFGSMSCQVRAQSKTITLISLHLQPALPKEGATLLEAIDLYLKTDKVREREVKQILSQKPTAPTIVLGDFNSFSTQFAPRYLQKLGYVDSFAKTNAKPEASFTWQWTYKDVNLQYRIDYIFGSQHFKPVSSQIIAEGPSDHYPVVSTFLLAR